MYENIISYFLSKKLNSSGINLLLTLVYLEMEGSYMVTVFGYIGFLIGALVVTLTLYIGLLKIKLI